VKPIPPEIKDYLSYDPETGKCTWIKATCNRVKVGSEAGNLNPDGYLAVGFKGTTYKNHRVAWYLHYGEDAGDLQIDHMNHDRADNRITNLRLATNQQNGQNTGSLGVTYHRSSKTWIAQIGLQGKKYHLGCYSCPLLAGIDYLAVKSILHPAYNA
jgi:hypothetical protein